MCTIYLCVEQRSKKVNVDGTKFVNMADEARKEHIFGDIFDDNLLIKLQALEQEILTVSGTHKSIPDNFREIEPVVSLEREVIYSDP